MTNSDTLLCSSLTAIASIVQLGICVLRHIYVQNVHISLFVLKITASAQHSRSMHHKHYINAIVLKRMHRCLHLMFV